MTREELAATLAEKHWYKESDDTRLYPEPSVLYLIMIACCLVYPLTYDGTQMAKQGSEYLHDPWNYVDILHIGLGYANISFQLYCGTWSLFTKAVLIVIILI